MSEAQPKETKATTAETTTEKAMKPNIAPTKEFTENSTTQKEVKVSAPTTKGVDTINEEKDAINETEQIQPESIIVDFVSQCDFRKFIESNVGKLFVIDVQPGMRYPVYIIVRESIKNYGNIDCKNLKNITLFSIISYSIMMYVAAILRYDIMHTREYTSQTHIWITDPARQKFLDEILKRKVCEYVEELISHIPPMNDTRNERLQFTPLFQQQFSHTITED